MFHLTALNQNFDESCRLKMLRLIAVKKLYTSNNYDKFFNWIYEKGKFFNFFKFFTRHLLSECCNLDNGLNYSLHCVFRQNTLGRVGVRF